MTTIVYENEFIFNELEYFTNLINNNEDIPNEQKIDLLNDMNLEGLDYKFVYQKDSQGSWFCHCYKGNERIIWTDTPHWMREYVWDFEKANKMFFL